MKNDVDLINEQYQLLREGQLKSLADAVIPTETENERVLITIAQNVIKKVGTGNAHTVANLIIDAVIGNKGIVRSEAEKQAAYARKSSRRGWDGYREPGRDQQPRNGNW